MSDSDSSASSEPTVRTEPTRESLDSQGRNSFDVAQRVRLPSSYRRGVRQLKTNLRSFIHAVELTKTYCPIQITSVHEQELRMRMVAVCGGSGHSLAMVDVELGETIRVIDDSFSYNICNCMSISAPLRKQKLAPLICSGHRDGRIILRDLQTGNVLLREICDIEHGGPITACHVCEGEKRTLAIAGSQDKAGIFTVYMYDFSRGTLACPPKQDHSVACTCIASVSVPMGHSYVCTGSIDGYVHIYEMLGDSMDRVFSFADNGGAVFDLDVLPGVAGGVRPSLLLVAGRGKAVQCYDLDSGDPFVSLATSKQVASLSLGGSGSGSGSRGLKVNTHYNGVRLAGHKGKVNAVRGIFTATLGCVTGGEDGFVCIWNLENQSLLMRFTGQHVPSTPGRPGSSEGVGDDQGAQTGLHEDEVSSISVAVHPRLFILTASFDQNLSIIDLGSSENEEEQRAYRVLMGKEARSKRRGASRRRTTVRGQGQGEEEEEKQGGVRGEGRSYRLGTIVQKGITAALTMPSSDSSNGHNYVGMRSMTEGNGQQKVASTRLNYDSKGLNKSSDDSSQINQGNIRSSDVKRNRGSRGGSAFPVPGVDEDQEKEKEKEEDCFSPPQSDSRALLKISAYSLVSSKDHRDITGSAPASHAHAHADAKADSPPSPSPSLTGLAPTARGRRNTVFHSPYASNNPKTRNTRRQSKVMAQLDRVRAGLPRKDPDAVNEEGDDSDSSSEVDSEDDIDFDNARRMRPPQRGNVTLNDLFADLEAVKVAQQRRRTKKADREAARKLAAKIARGERIEAKREETETETEEERRKRETKAVMDAFAELTESSTDDEVEVDSDDAEEIGATGKGKTAKERAGARRGKARHVQSATN